MNNTWNYANTEVDNDFESFEYKEIKEQLNTTDHLENTTYNFIISDEHSYILYSGGYLHQQLKIVKANDASIGEENVTLVNGGGMLKTSTLTIGTTIMGAEVNYTSLLMHILGLVNFNPNYLTSQPTNMLYYPDTADSADRKDLKYDGALTDQTTLTTFFQNLKLNDQYNEGFVKRWNLTKNSQSVDIWIPLKYIFGFFNDFRKVIKGFEVKMDFQRESNVNMLYTNVQNPDYKVTVERMSLWLPYVQFKPAIHSKFQQILNSKHDISWCQPRIVRSIVQHPDVVDGAFSIPATSDEVYSLLVVPQFIERQNNYNQNNMIFDHLNMKECWLMVNNVKIPLVNYTMDFGRNKYPRIYDVLLQTGENTIDSITGCLISRETFGSLYPIICFDLSHHKSYIDLSNLMIEFNWKLNAQPGKQYVFYFVLMERKRCQLDMVTKTITPLKTLHS